MTLDPRPPLLLAGPAMERGEVLRRAAAVRAVSVTPLYVSTGDVHADPACTGVTDAHVDLISGDDVEPILDSRWVCTHCGPPGLLTALAAADRLASFNKVLANCLPATPDDTAPAPSGTAAVFSDVIYARAHAAPTPDPFRLGVADLLEHLRTIIDAVRYEPHEPATTLVVTSAAVDPTSMVQLEFTGRRAGTLGGHALYLTNTRVAGEVARASGEHCTTRDASELSQTQRDLLGTFWSPGADLGEVVRAVQAATR